MKWKQHSPKCYCNHLPSNSIISPTFRYDTTGYISIFRCYESGKVYQKNFELNKKTLTERIAQLEKRASRMDEKYEYTDSKVQEMTIK